VDEVSVGMGGDDPGQSGLPTARGAPKDQRLRRLTLKNPREDLPWAQQMRLAGKLCQYVRPHALRKWCMGQVLVWDSSMQKVELFHGFLVFALFLGHFSSQFKNITVKPKNKYDSNYLFV
jgi:hypothetical protein